MDKSKITNLQELVFESAQCYGDAVYVKEKKGKEQLEKLDEIINKEKEVRYVRAQKREPRVHIFHSEKDFEWQG